MDVVVPTFNNLAELRSCLMSLDSQDVRVFVCVDGSTDGTREYLASSSFPFEIRVLEHPDRQNHGRAAARNLALQHLNSPMVLFLDSDMELAPHAVESHMDLLDSCDCVSIGDVLYRNASSNLWARYQGTRGKNRGHSRDVVRPLDFNTQNVALRTADLLAAGGFDDSLPVYGGEDTELGLRLAGLRSLSFVFNPAAVATTVEPKTVETGLAQLREFGKSNLRTIRQRHRGRPAPFWIDRLESRRLADRAFVALLNPISDLFVDAALSIRWFPLQRRLLNYKVIRAVWTGYRDGSG